IVTNAGVATPKDFNWNNPPTKPPVAAPIHAPNIGFFNRKVIPYNAGSVIPANKAENAEEPDVWFKSLFLYLIDSATAAALSAMLEQNSATLINRSSPVCANTINLTGVNPWCNRAT